MPNNFGLSYHVIVDGLDSNQLDTLLEHLKLLQPAWINITGGSRFTQAMQFVERLRRDCPNINIILRNFKANGIEDNGVSSKLTPAQWYNAWVLPIRDWLKQYKPVLMTDNEGVVGGTKLRDYSDWMAAAIKMCAPDGIQLGVGRFPTGTPEFADYQYLESMFRALETYGGVWTPNEYFGQTAPLSNSMPGRFLNGLMFCDSKGIKRPTVVIGEYGATYAKFGARGEIVVDANKGFIWLGWSEDKLFQEGASYFEPWIQPHDATVCFFAHGAINEFASFNVMSAFMKRMLAYKQSGKGIINTVITQPPPVQETNVQDGVAWTDPAWKQALVKSKVATSSINVRLKPSATGNTPIGTIKEERLSKIIRKVEWGDWIQVRYDNDKLFGWVDSKLLTIVETTEFITFPRNVYDAAMADIHTAEALLEKTKLILKV